MVRTMISLEPELKRWFDRKAKREKVPMSRVVRKALIEYRRRNVAVEPPFEELVEKTFGTWKGADGLAIQRRLRAEWDR